MLNADKQFAVMALRGSSIRAVERMTGMHRDMFRKKLLSDLPSRRGREMRKQPKPRKSGRPRLAKSAAEGTIVPVRFNPEDRRRVVAAAKASNKTVSEWVRCTLAAAMEG